MTKADLIAVIADKLRLNPARAELLVDTIFDSLVQAIHRGEKIELRGFGAFHVREYKP
jgi:integration host factor subunit beta